MQLIDTHTHLYLPEFDSDRDAVVGRAVQNGVVQAVLCQISTWNRSARCYQLKTVIPGICYPMIGLHPTSVRKITRISWISLKKSPASHKFYAIGEIGIDLYWDQTFLKEQIEAFKRQVAFAIRSGLPVVIHSRNSFPESLSGPGRI